MSGTSPGRGLARTLLANTSSNVFKFAVSVVITFVMTPVYLRALGDHDYGVWEMIGSIVGYLGLLDVGLQPTISRFIARVSPSSEGHRWRQVYSTGWVLMAVAGLLIGAVFLAWSLVEPRVLADHPARAQRYALFLQLMAIQVALTFPRLGLESALEGTQRYVAKNNVVILHTVLSSVFLYLYIDAWDPLLVLCAVGIVTGLSKTAWFLWMLAPPGDGPRLPSVRLFDGALAKEMYGFGVKSFLQGTASVVEARTGVLIIGAFLGPAAVVFYAIPQALLSRIRDLTWTLTHGLMPAFSDLDARGKRQTATLLFSVGSRLMVAGLVLLCGGAGLLGGAFISLWVGKRYVEQGQVILWILTGYLFLSMLTPLGSRYLTALGRHGPLAKIGLTRAGLNLGISVALVGPLGAPGVALGSLMATALTVPYEWRAVLTPLGMTIQGYLRTALLPSVGPLLAMATVATAAEKAGFTGHWPGLLAAVGLSVLAFGATFALFGIAPEDRTCLARLLGNPGKSGAPSGAAASRGPGRIPGPAPRIVEASGKEIEQGDVRKRGR